LRPKYARWPRVPKQAKICAIRQPQEKPDFRYACNKIGITPPYSESSLDGEIQMLIILLILILVFGFGGYRMGPGLGYYGGGGISLILLIVLILLLLKVI
jgi:hypothetical protein